MTVPGALGWSWRGARDALTALAGELERRSVPVAVLRAYPSVGLLVLSCGIAVWCYARVLSWRCDGQVMTWPAADASGAARRLAEAVSRSAGQAEGDFYC